jgi:hypothetical protein
MKTLLAIIPALLLASCATKPKPLPLIPIPKAKPVAEDVASASEYANKAADLAAKQGERLQAAINQTKSAKEYAQVTAKEAKRLADQGRASGMELANMATLTSETPKHVGVIEGEMYRLAELNLEQAVSLGDLRRQLTEASINAAKSDQALDFQTQQAQTQAAAYQQEAKKNDDMMTKMAKLVAEIGKLKALLFWVGGISGLYLLLRILKLTPTGKLLRFWLP